MLGHEVVTRRRMMSYLVECLIHHKAIWQGNKAQSSGILILRYQRQRSNEGVQCKWHEYLFMVLVVVVVVGP